MNTAVLRPQALPGKAPLQAAGIGLWFFIGVATMLFSLFITAYAMRMDSGDWTRLAMPGQLWLSTALLLAGSALLQGASAAATASRWDRARTLLLAGGACAFAFLASQWWAWQAMQAARVTLAGNPAASFFYLLTGLHGLHVLGGLVAWWATARRAGQGFDTQGLAQRIALCARYWHFLLAAWLLLFAALGLLTPEIVRFICGRS